MSEVCWLFEKTSLTFISYLPALLLALQPAGSARDVEEGFDYPVYAKLNAAARSQVALDVT